MRLTLSATVVAASIIWSHVDGYDRFDLCAGFVGALGLTWCLGYTRKPYTRNP